MAPRIVLIVFPFLAVIALAAPAATQSSVEVKKTKLDISPTVVSLKLNKVSASEMFNKLAGEAKISLTAQNDGMWNDPVLAEASFSTEWEKATLWEAVREACEAAGVRVLPDQSQEARGRVQLHTGPPPAYVAIDGPVMVWPRHLQRTASVRYGDGSRQPDEIRLTLTILLEPKLRQFAWYGRPTIEEAQDNQGNSLLRPAQPNAEGDSSSMPIVLNYPPKPGNRIALVRGSITMQVPKTLATISYRPPFDKLENITTDVGPNRLLLKSMRRDGEGHRVNFSLVRGADVSDAQWSVIGEPFGRFAAPITMVSFSGESGQNGGSAGGGQKEAHTELYFNPREAGDEATELRVVLPIEFETLTAKFEFKDLPMP